MRSTGWGRYPAIETTSYWPATHGALARTLIDLQTPTIARGMGRSYGDASLADHLLIMTRLDQFIVFDAERGELRCGAGVTLAACLELTVPRGWFLPVLPGTGMVTVGGAIAADVHGKNHHHDGSFSEFVEDFEMMLADGSRLTCSRHEHAELFQATAGGMGLTGVILAARLRLKAITSSYIEERMVAADHLDAALALLDEHAAMPYVVAWIDVNQRGAAQGRALIMLGAHAAEGGLRARARRALTVPFDLPAGLLGRSSATAFNALYFRLGARRTVARHVHYAQYFFPLDALQQWNRLYGGRGFLQHQCVIPPDSAPQALREMLSTVASSGLASPLAVLKAFGPGNDNLLSFARAGLTLTMDFAMDAATLALFARLDDFVVAYGGRIYLAKDACMAQSTFRRGYPEWENFQALRERYGASARFASLQSRRLGL